MKFSIQIFLIIIIQYVVAQYFKPYDVIYVNQGPVAYSGRMTQIKVVIDKLSSTISDPTVFFDRVIPDKISPFYLTSGFGLVNKNFSIFSKKHKNRKTIFSRSCCHELAKLC